MKIAFLSRYQDTINRGGETFVRELSGALAKKHTVEILTGCDADNLSKIISGKFDIVVAVNGRMQSLKASFGRIFGGYKLVIAGESGIGKDDIWNIAAAKPDAFVALTEKMEVWAKKWAWGSRIVKIPNGVDLEKFKPDGAKAEIGLKYPVVLSVGALTWYKHHERVIEALSFLPDVSLLIVGKGEEEEKLKKMAQARLGDRFKIISAPYEELPKIYRAADLFTLPSWDREAFGIVYVEALSSGLPVVAPDDLARKEIVGDGGVLVDVSDSKAYAEAIEKALRINWGDKPRKQAEKFSWEKVAGMYEKLFKDLN